MIDIVFSFDTTGSMSPCIAEVRRRLDETIGKIFSTFPNVRIGLVAHGDYCDEGSNWSRKDSYVTRTIDLTTNESSLRSFITTTKNTSGGDNDECYEKVLHDVQNFSWNGETHCLVMIGDANPHEERAYKTDPYCMKFPYYDWKTECVHLREKGVRIYSVHALGNSSSRSFWTSMASLTGGTYLQLHQLSDIIQLINGVTYQENGQLDSYREELKTTGFFNHRIQQLLNSLDGSTTVESVSSVSTGLIPVNPSRFQVFVVDRITPIKQFVTDMDIKFRIGRGFYELTKPSLIQEKKEVIVEDRITGQKYTGNEAREILGIPSGTRGTARPSSSKWKIFIQSTSVNRKLLPGTSFLYEVK